MKKIGILLFLCLFLSGCATYKFQKGSPPYDKGYVVSRDGQRLLEYTAGKDNSVPDMDLAKERFKRRKDTVEDYYKKMGYIENRFKQAFLDPPVMLVKFMGGFLRLPFIAVSDYKYEHNPQHREKIQKLEAEKDAACQTRIKGLKEELNAYIQKDLTKEPPLKEEPKATKLARLEPEEVSPPLKTAPEQEAKESKPQLAAPKEKIKPQKVRPKTLSLASCVAVIVAQPQKGCSPLKVQFYGYRSHSSSGKIVSYYWEFGDGDTSTKENPTNIYWSATYGSRHFTATLTVKDNQGNTASTSTVIEVMTK